MNFLIVGILALQGDVREHINIVKKTLKNTQYQITIIKKVSDLSKITHLIIPGGESTVMHNLMIIDEKNNILSEIKRKYNDGMCIFGTCAGAILLCNNINNNSKDLNIEGLGLINISMIRNAYGRQVDSYETDIIMRGIKEKFHAIFIRAPKIESLGENVEIVAKYKNQVVMARNRQILVCTFHPELTNDTRIHNFFFQF